MTVEEDIQKLENRVQDNIEILSEKIINYNKKLNEFNSDGSKQNKNFKVNYNLIFIEFLLLYITIYIILSKTKLDFVCDKIKNKTTYFIENELSIIKLIGFSFTITVCLLVVFNFIYLFIYVQK